MAKKKDNSTQVSKPQQERSIQKKQLIIDVGMELFSKQGYHHTNTAEIAKAANVSTGIVYRYFPDKKAIFLDGLKQYIEKMTGGIADGIDHLSSLNNLDLFLSKIISYAIEIHIASKPMHEEVECMIHYDSDIAKLYCEFEDNITHQFVEKLFEQGFQIDHAHEKMHVILHMIETYCHETVFHQHLDMDYDEMKKIVIKNIIYTLSS